MAEIPEDDFECQLQQLLAKSGKLRYPPLSSERQAYLQTLIPKEKPQPWLLLRWEKAVDQARNTLALVKSIGVQMIEEPLPLLRGENETTVNLLTLALPDGELRVQITPLEKQNARLSLSVRGKYQTRTDISVEVTQGDNLIEVRPLELKSEITLPGTGSYTISLLDSNSKIGCVQMDIS